MPDSQEKIQQAAINELLNKKISSRADLMAKKRQLSKKYGLPLLSSPEILKEYKKRLARGLSGRFFELEKILRKRSVRTSSGIAPVAVLTKAYPCPGQCVYCPKEKDVPQSYLANEPAVMRAILCGFDPYKQVRFRLKALEVNGHEPEKIELIVIGGTWSVLPEKYKYWYIKECFRAANEFGSVILERSCQAKRGDEAIESHSYDTLNVKMRCYPCLPAGRAPTPLRSSMTKLKHDLTIEQKKNESAKYRIIGITLETRPDYINEKELRQMRELGATRVELGVQAVDDKILKLNKRGHGVLAVARATELLKNYGFKVTYHIMPGLPGSTAKKDLAMFKLLFSDSRFQPDQLKFYPTVVTRGSLLHKWWREGRYRPYSDKVLRNLIVACKKIVPPYVRIIRLIRDIPAESILAGNKITNLRQIMKDRGAVCRCIRCREAGDKKFSIFLPTGQAGNFSAQGRPALGWQFSIIKYQASGGEEYFLNFESKDGKTLYGFCRLRLSPKNLMGAAFIRELHVYGELVPVGAKKIIQHAGLGKSLMKAAEKIAQQADFKKISIISGVGVRGYYRKLGYKLQGSYMVKSLV